MSAGTEYERSAWRSGRTLIGIDEAGRGPLAGPLCVAGVILPEDFPLERLEDSKKLSERQRMELYPLILERSVYHDIRIVSVEEIDRYDIYHATMRAMASIAESSPCDLVLTDAMPLSIGKPCRSLVKGDHLSASIAAASILAKVTRDQIMYLYDEIYPQFGYASHKGYPTKAHLEAMRRHPLPPIYRKSYSPVRKILGI